MCYELCTILRTRDNPPQKNSTYQNEHHQVDQSPVVLSRGFCTEQARPVICVEHIVLFEFLVAMGLGGGRVLGWGGRGHLPPQRRGSRRRAGLILLVLGHFSLHLCLWCCGGGASIATIGFRDLRRPVFPADFFFVIYGTFLFGPLRIGTSLTCGDV